MSPSEHETNEQAISSHSALIAGMAVALRLWLLASLAVAAALVGLTDQTRAQSDRAVEWDRFDVQLELQQDGSYRVTETQVVAFDGGPFRTGFADIPLTN